MKDKIISTIIGSLVTAVLGYALLLTGTLSKILITQEVTNYIERSISQNNEIIAAVANEFRSRGNLELNTLKANEILVGNGKVEITQNDRGGLIILNKSDGESAALILVESDNRGGVFRAWDYAYTKHVDLEAVRGVRLVPGQ